MITLPAAFEIENKKKDNVPAVIVYVEESELQDNNVTQADWTANVDENDVNYVARAGAVLLASNNLWVCDITTDKVYNIEQDGTLISSFETSVYDVSSTNPTGISYAPDGTLWIIDLVTDKIYNIDQIGTLISSFATSVYDGSATVPTGISSAANGTLWVCDATTDKIYNIKTDGTLISSFDTSVYDVSATGPTGIGYSSDGTLWICDAITDKVYNTKTDGTLISSFDTSVYDASSTSPQSVSYSLDDTLWVSDVDTDKVYNIETDGTLISSFATSVFDAGATSPQGISKGAYARSGHITVDFDLGSIPDVGGEWQIGDSLVNETEDNLWVCDAITDKIYNIEQDGTLISSFATSVFDAGATAPSGVSSAANGTLWVCDAITDKIYNIEQDGTLISSFATSVFDAGATSPQSVSYSLDDTLWVVDTATEKIYNIEQDGTLISSFATSVFDVSAIGPTGISYAVDGTLWICDSGTDKVYNIETDGTLISSFLTSVYDAGATNPTDVSIAPDGTLWVCDSVADKIYNIETDGTLISSFATSVFDAGATNPHGVSFTTSLGIITYQAWGSATGAFAGEETNLGFIIDGHAITQLFRYYRVKAFMTSTLDRTKTPTLLGITASFTTFMQLTDTKGLGYNVEIEKDGLSSLTTRIDHFKASTIGEINITTAFSEKLSAFFSVPRKNHLVKIFQGFKGLAESDFINYFYGVIGNAPISTGEEVTIDVDDYTTTWEKPVPSKWETIADDVIWVSIHPIDVLIDIFQNYLDVRDIFIDYDSFTAVKESIPTWRVSRTITGGSISGDKLINELRQLMSCFLIPQPDGRVSITQYDPTASAVVSITDDDFILAPGMSYDPQYKELLNHFTTYYGWDGLGTDLDNYTGLDDYTNSASVTAWKEEKHKIIKDNWTPSGNTSQVTARRDVLDGIYGNAPTLLTGSLTRRLLWLEVGDIVNITINRYPKSSGYGITDKKFLLIKRNYNYNKGNIGVSFLEV